VSSHRLIEVADLLGLTSQMDTLTTEQWRPRRMDTPIPARPCRLNLLYNCPDKPSSPADTIIGWTVDTIAARGKDILKRLAAMNSH
jgi:hypothetical protein